jgi:predicted RNA-binding Zn ribbon-like protein
MSKDPSHPCIEFLNTESVEQGRRVDRLPDASAFVAWLEALGAIDHRAARYARRHWCATQAGVAVMVEVHALRRLLRRTVVGIVGGRGVPWTTLAAVNDVLARGHQFLAVEREAEGLVLRMLRPIREPSDLLQPVAEAAADLIAVADSRRIGLCAHPDCIQFFYDTSKNGTRRWCDMRTCGNRANVAAHYRRSRGR